MKINPREALHTFARHYCIERLAALRQARDEAREQKTSNEFEHGVPRRAVVEAILVEVERLVPDEFNSRSHAAFRLVEAGQTAQTYFTRQKMWNKPPYPEAMQQERDRFRDAVEAFLARGVWSVEPLPYRRTLSEEESARLMERLRRRWGITGRWWVPLEKYELPYEVIVLDSSSLRDNLGIDRLRDILAKRSIGRVYELWEHDHQPHREMALSLWNPYDGLWSEQYWFTAEIDWLYYTTHEGSTSIAGAWLLEDIKALWPQWSEHRWVAPWLTADPSK